MEKEKISDKAIERLCLYRRYLYSIQNQRATIRSADLGEIFDITAEVVRRDMMSINNNGDHYSGYNVKATLKLIEHVLPSQTMIPTLILGLGEMGESLIKFFNKKHPRFNIVAGFDPDPTKINEKISDCYCYTMMELNSVRQSEEIFLGIITPTQNSAQESADLLIAAGIKSILNFTFERIRTPDHIHVENIDIEILLEKCSYYGKNQ